MNLLSVDISDEDFIELEDTSGGGRVVEQVARKGSPAMVTLHYGADVSKEVDREEFEAMREKTASRLTDNTFKEGLAKDLDYLENKAKEYGEVTLAHGAATEFPTLREIYLGIGFILERPNGKQYTLRYFIPLSYFDQVTQDTVLSNYNKQKEGWADNHE